MHMVNDMYAESWNDEVKDIYAVLANQQDFDRF